MVQTELPTFSGEAGDHPQSDGLCMLIVGLRICLIHQRTRQYATNPPLYVPCPAQRPHLPCPESANQGYLSHMAQEDTYRTYIPAHDQQR